MDLPHARARLVVATLPVLPETVAVEGEEVAHAHARRLRPGDPVVLVDGSGREAVGRVARVGERRVEIAVEAVRIAPLEEGPPVALLVAAVRSERLAWIAEKATELGAARLAIVRSAHTQSFRAASALLARLERVVREAAKQGERARWPEIMGVLSFEEALGVPAPQRLLLDAKGFPFPAALEEKPLALLIGPEGGWTAEEARRAEEREWSRVALPAGKLRTETAAIAALVLARAAMGRKA